MADDATTQTAVTDDQELAKVLANMSDEEGKQQAPEAPAPEAAAPAAEVPAAPLAADQEGGLVSAADPLMVAPPPQSAPEAPQAAPAAPAPEEPQMVAPAPVSAPGDLGEIKKLALDELRPIVNELELPAKDKFDALLLVIRSSDDQSLIKSAYAAANGITDPAEKAQALLDIIKEIEYFSQQGVAPTA